MSPLTLANWEGHFFKLFSDILYIEKSINQDNDDYGIMKMIGLMSQIVCLI